MFKKQITRGHLAFTSAQPFLPPLGVAIMSDYVELSSGAGIPVQSISNVLSPGIVSLFVQGLETGLVISQLSQWLSLEQRDGTAITVLVIFVTTVGFVETAVCFTSAWRIYVHNFGQLIVPQWTESVHALLSTLIAAPIQAYFIWRCYHIMKNIYLIIPLVVTLVSTVVAAGWVTAWIFHMHAAARSNSTNHNETSNNIVYPFVVFLTLPAVLDITITSILLHSLIKFLKRIHAEHIRRRVTRYIVVTWQAVIPPCVCAVALLIKYVTFTQAHPGKQQMWYAAIQAMLGKLYVLSLYFTLNNRMDLATNEPPVTYATTMDVSLDSMGSPTRGYVFSVHFPDREQVC
ncbi:hypothetical protein DFH94DRAFT_7955 [Russula ochroleuca]|uniref:DUF6534 domain-containing protein n=1 Tax=Russula ochroleuca TaxID=152965 RepID=A0A9P5TDP8_9AGAM|nr:hypothetical protein DFH94DRAFT_7955 [Russula ochroleuca]